VEKICIPLGIRYIEFKFVLCILCNSIAVKGVSEKVILWVILEKGPAIVDIALIFLDPGKVILDKKS